MGPFVCEIGSEEKRTSRINYIHVALLPPNRLRWTFEGFPTNNPPLCLTYSGDANRTPNAVFLHNSALCPLQESCLQVLWRRKRTGRHDRPINTYRPFRPSRKANGSRGSRVTIKCSWASPSQAMPQTIKRLAFGASVSYVGTTSHRY